MKNDPQQASFATPESGTVCAEFAELSNRFGSTPRLFQSWKVEPVPPGMEEIMSAPHGRTPLAANSTPGPAARRRRRWMLAVLWAGGVAAAGLLTLVAIQRLHAPAVSIHRGLQLNALHAASRNSSVETVISPPEKLLQGYAMRQSSAMMAMKAPLPADALDSAVRESPAPSPAALPVTAPMIAHSVALTIVVKNFAPSRASLEALLARHHGYAAQLMVTTPQNSARSFQASLRVPASELAATLAELKSLGRIENETQSGEEVTQQHADLLARLKNARETEQRLQAILMQRTGKIEDVLDVEREIARVRGEIESMAADQQNLEHRVDFASIDLQLNEEYQAEMSAPASPSIATQIHNALVSGYQHARDTVLAMVLFAAEDGPTLLILFALICVPAFFIIRRFRRLRSHLSSIAEQPSRP